MNTFSIKEAVGHGWAIFKQNKSHLVLSTLLFMIVTKILEIGPWGEGSIYAITAFIAVLAFFVSIAIDIGWIKFLLGFVDGGRPKIKEMFSHWKLIMQGLKAMVTILIIAVIPALIGGLVPAIIWGTDWDLLRIAITTATVLVIIYLLIKYHFVMILAVDKKIRIWDAVKKSAEMTEGVMWKLAGFFVVIGLLNILGFIALVVGILVSVPVTGLAHFYVYRKLSAEAFPALNPVVSSPQI